jgi:predicted NAD/FAD-binding protein
MIFVAKALPALPTSPIQYYVLNPGMIEVLSQMIARTSTVEVRTDARVTLVTRSAQGGFDIQCVNGQSVHVDDLAFASSGPATLSLLPGLTGTSAQQAALAQIEFRDATLALHTDPIYAPANPDYWSFFNARIDGNFCEASMWLKDVLTEPTPDVAAMVWKSWITHRSQAPAQILAQAQFRHMVPTPSSLHGQDALAALQGEGDVWFVGGYTRPFDSQETALTSAFDVAQGLLGR